VIKVCQFPATGRWFSVGAPVFSSNKTDRHDITEILLKISACYLRLREMIMNLASNNNNNVYKLHYEMITRKLENKYLQKISISSPRYN
jgi:hypothetical protein